MKLKQISWLPIVIMMGIIFYFSSRPAVSSDESSMIIANKVLGIYERMADVSLQDDVRLDRVRIINHVVRKGAHFLEYAALALTIAFHFWIKKRNGIKLFMLSVVIATIYATMDEFHQLFVPGRSGEILDVLIDMSGAATASLLFCLFTRKATFLK